MRRRAQREIVAVDLDAARSTMREPEIADDLTFDAVEHPGRAAVPAIRHATERAGRVKTFRNEADAEDLLRRPAKVLPEAALLARRGEIILAGPGLPRAHAGIQLAHLHAPWLVLVISDVPVKSVAAEIDEAAAVGDVVLDGVEDRLRNIFGMGSTQHHLVWFQKFDTVAMQILVGDDIVGIAHVFEPGDDGKIRRKLPRHAHRGHAGLGPHVQDRPTIAAVTDAGTVAMVVVDRETKFGGLIQF